MVARFENNHAAWRNELDNNGLPKLFPAKDFWSWAVASKPRSAALEAARTFVTSWSGLLNGDGDLCQSAPAEHLIQNRELGLKGSRSRLRNPSLLASWAADFDRSGGGSGLGRFDYNWGVTYRILDDIHVGLGSSVIAAPDEAVASA